MAQDLVVGECAKVRRIIVRVLDGQRGSKIEFIDPLYIPLMAMYQGLTGTVRSINKTEKTAVVEFSQLGVAHSWEFRIVDLEWESPHTRDQDLLSMHERGFFRPY